MRGLEAGTPSGYRKKHAIRLNALYFVLAEQGRQYQVGRKDDMTLAAMYSHTTIESRIEAIELAKHDAAAAAEECHHDRSKQPQSFKDSWEPKELFNCRFLFNPSKWFAPNKNALVLLEETVKQF
jgi:hypothetical protein